MYCKNCGHNNPDTANYCENDGHPLSQIPQKFKPNGQAQICSYCGTKAASDQTYCVSCSRTLVRYEKDTGLPPKMNGKKTKKVVPSFKAGTFNFRYLKNAVISLIATFAILLFFALITVSSFERLMDNTGGSSIEDMIDFIEEESGEYIRRPDRIIGITDIMMLTNIQDSTFVFEVKGDIGYKYEQIKSKIDLDNGSLIYLPVLFIALFAAGIIMGIIHKGPYSNRLWSALSIALVYSVTLAVLSLFSGFSYKHRFSDDENLFFVINIANEYSFIQSLFWGFIFGFLFAGLGLLFSIDFRKTTGHLRKFTSYGESLHQAFSTLIRGHLLMFAVVFTILLIKAEEYKDSLYPIPLSLVSLFEKIYFLLSVQLSHYVWGLLHFTPLSFIFEDRDLGEYGRLKYSVFNGFSVTGDESGLGYLEFLLTETTNDLFLKLAYLIPLILFIWAGYKIAQAPHNLTFKLLVFSFSYALLMTGLASLSNIGFSFSGTGGFPYEGMVNFGFPLITIFFASLIFSLIGAFNGTLINKLLT